METYEIMKLLSSAKEEDVDEILDAVFARRRELFPDWDMIYFALPKNNPKERKMLLEQALEVLMRE